MLKFKNQMRRLRNFSGPISAYKRHLANTSNRFAKDERGTVAIVFVLALLPMIMIFGIGIDYSRLAIDRAQTQDAIDAAALAVVSKISRLNDGEVRNMVEAYMRANVPGDVDVNIDLVIIERNPNALKVWATGTTDMTFASLFGVDSYDYKAKSKAVASDKTIEVALVLDNSGSMGGQRIKALKEASTALVNILEENQQSSEDLLIGVVPFNHLVRVDKGYKDASWLDQEAKASLHRENLPPKSNRFDLFDTLTDPYTNKAEEWEGCVEARKHPYDIIDSAPTTSHNDSYFLPYFYPDTRERHNSKNNNKNDYLPKKVGKNKPDKTTYEEFGEYRNQKFKKGRGPNYQCYIKKILALTTNMNTVRSHIQGMNANGWTNIHMGTIWGLRVLSPQSPFTEGQSYSDKENIKFLIVMSDGANTYTSQYHAYGWSNDGRISGSNSVVKEMNKRTLESCTSAKNDGVIVYTIAYGNIGSSTTRMLESCATLPENAFTPKSTSEMITVFKKIAEALNKVRLSE